MTEKIWNLLIIEDQLPEKCDLCGAVEECRPYGPMGENVCFNCMKKNEAAAKRAFKARLDGGN